MGDDTTYQILVTNAGAQSQFDVAVTASFSGELRFDGLTSDLHGAVLPNAVRFDPRRELRPGETLSFELRMKGVQAGTGRFHVDVTATGQPRSVTADQTSEILP